MSVSTVVNLMHELPSNCANTLLWVMSKVNYNGLLKCILHGHIDPTSEIKYPLLEYAYTSRYLTNFGYENIVDYMPNGKILVHHALQRQDFLDALKKYFGDDNPNIEFYTRQKVGKDGLLDFNRRQLMIVFKPGTFSEK